MIYFFTVGCNIKRKALCNIAMKKVTSLQLNLRSVFLRFSWLRRLIQLFFLFFYNYKHIILGFVMAMNLGGKIDLIRY